MTGNVTHFDKAREMYRRMSEDDNMEGCFMAIAVYIDKEANVVSGVAWDDEIQEPFRMIGALEMLKQRIMAEFIA